MKVRQYRSNQGRSPQQQETNETMMFVSYVGMLVVILALIVYGIFV
tara:strand:+ start:854 stop:991 length:138 start_codon:yes stop_codon:yes gene_type:complete